MTNVSLLPGVSRLDARKRPRGCQGGCRPRLRTHLSAYAGISASLATRESPRRRVLSHAATVPAKNRGVSKTGVRRRERPPQLTERSRPPRLPPPGPPKSIIDLQKHADSSNFKHTSGGRGREGIQGDARPRRSPAEARPPFH